MIHDLEICAVCGAGDRCGDCFGSGSEPDRPGDSCMSCGGSGDEPPMLPTCSEDGCGVRLGGTVPGTGP